MKNPPVPDVAQLPVSVHQLMLIKLQISLQVDVLKYSTVQHFVRTGFDSICTRLSEDSFKQVIFDVLSTYQF